MFVLIYGIVNIAKILLRFDRKNVSSDKKVFFLHKSHLKPPTYEHNAGSGSHPLEHFSIRKSRVSGRRKPRRHPSPSRKAVRKEKKKGVRI